MSSFRPGQRSDRSLLAPREETWTPRPLPALPPGPRLQPAESQAPALPDSLASAQSRPPRPCARHFFAMAVLCQEAVGSGLCRPSCGFQPRSAGAPRASEGSAFSPCSLPRAHLSVTSGKPSSRSLPPQKTPSGRGAVQPHAASTRPHHQALPGGCRGSGVPGQSPTPCSRSSSPSPPQVSSPKSLLYHVSMSVLIHL